MLPTLRQAWKAARVSDAGLLIEGETGTGKQVLAQAVHQLDEKRRAHRFVTVHCGNIPESLAESELFGHKKGAFSGAAEDRRGLFLSAHHGALFLDDVNDLPLSLQPKLLDVLQRSKLRSLGSDHETAVDVRIIAAANQPLLPLVRAGKFRADLFYRLDVIHLRLPPLRERREDLPALLMTMCRKHAGLYGASIESIDRSLLEHLEAVPFEGNIRELEHCVQRALLYKTDGLTLTVGDWEAADSPEMLQEAGDHLTEAAASLWQTVAAGEATLADAVGKFERSLLMMAVNHDHGTRRELAGRLGISERKLYQLLRAYRLDAVERKPAASFSALSRAVG